MVRFIRNSTRRLPLPPVSRIDQKSFLKQLEKEEKLQTNQEFVQDTQITQKNENNVPVESKKFKNSENFKKKGVDNDKVKIEDQRIKQHLKFIKRLGHKVEDPVLWKKKYKFYPFGEDSKEIFRCQDEFKMNSELKSLSMVKKEHLEIAKAFQSLDNPCWKYVKVKSNSKTDQISVLASLNSNSLLKNEDPFFHRTNIQDCKNKLIEKLAPLCNSMHIITSKKDLKENRNKVQMEKIKGEDYLIDNFGNFEIKFGPFADIPVFPEVWTKIFIQVFLHNQGYLKDPNVVIDFGCNSGIFGVTLGKKSNRIIGLDSAPVHLENSKINADFANIPNDYRLGPTVDNLNRIFEVLHYENKMATIILHSSPGKEIPLGIFKAIVDCANVKNVILFATYPEIEAFQAMSLFLEKRENKGRFRFNKQFLFEMCPDKSARLQFVFCFNSHKNENKSA